MKKMRARLPEKRLIELRRLHWVLATLTLSILPHADHLPTWTLVSFAVFATWRYAHTRFEWRLMGRMLLLLTAFLQVLGVLFTYRTLNGIDAGTALMVVMIAMKLMETNARRDFILIIFLCYFLVVSTFLYTQSIPIALLMVPTVLVISSALLEITRPEGRAMPMRKALAKSGGLLAQAIPLMLILFILFPRIPGPLWGLPSRSSGVSGLSDEMSPGALSTLSRNPEPAFRVRFDGDLPPPSQRYWRGPVLHEFDGRTWRGGPQSDIEETGFDGIGDELSYTVTMEATQRRWLFMLDLPSRVPTGAELHYDFEVRNRHPVVGLKRYSAASFTDYRLNTRPTDYAILRDSYLPQTVINPRTRALGQQFQDESSSDYQVMLKALRMFTEQEFTYTLNPGRLGASPMDDFLFQTRRGILRALRLVVRPADALRRYPGACGDRLPGR